MCSHTPPRLRVRDCSIISTCYVSLVRWMPGYHCFFHWYCAVYDVRLSRIYNGLKVVFCLAILPPLILIITPNCSQALNAYLLCFLLSSNGIYESCPLIQTLIQSLETIVATACHVNYITAPQKFSLTFISRLSEPRAMSARGGATKVPLIYPL